MKKKKIIAIIGGGPSGLMAAEILGLLGHDVTVYDRMPSLGRKFLMAGRGGLNLTHSEPLKDFIGRYGSSSDWLAPYIESFPPADLRAWCEGLGQKSFIGTSGRIFPRSMKTAPLLRAWLQRLEKLGVKYQPRYCWLGFENDSLKFINAEQEIILVKADATLLALGGATWPRLGSDGGWVNILSECGVEISPLRPANCGFIVPWSDYFSARFAGTPLKSVTLNYHGISQGDIMITKQGIEGGPVYALSAGLREAIEAKGSIVLHIDLRPGISVEVLTKKLQAPRGSQSLSNYLRKAGFSPLSISLLREVTPPEQLAKLTPDMLAAHFKNLPLKLTATADMYKAISTAGGIKQSSLNKNFMLHAKPGVFAAGEMLDWEAPTGGYLLQACFSTAVAAANGMQNFLQEI